MQRSRYEKRSRRFRTSTSCSTIIGMIVNARILWPTILVGIIGGLAIFLNVVNAQAPVVPMQISGTVSVASGAKCAGTKVTGRFGTFTTYATGYSDANGVYYFNAPADNPDTSAAEGFANGQTILVYAWEDLKGSVTMQSTGIAVRDFIVDACLVATPTPRPSGMGGFIPGGGGGGGSSSASTSGGGGGVVVMTPTPVITAEELLGDIADDPEAAGEALASIAAQDAQAAGEAIAGAAEQNPDAAGAAIAAAAAADAAAIGVAIIAAGGANTAATGAAVAIAGALNAAATGAAIAAAAAENASVAGEILAAGAATNAEAIGSVLAFSASSDATATGRALAAAAKADAASIGQALASAASVDAVNVGLALAVSAAENTDAIGSAIASSAKTDAVNTGIMLASAASADAVAVGEAIAVAAQADAVAIGRALLAGAKTDLESIGKAVTAAAVKNPSAIGVAMAVAATDDAATAGDILIVVASENVAAAGEMLAFAADSNPASISESLLIAATIAMEDISRAVAKAAAVNATAVGLAISMASESNTTTTGQILANGAKEDPVAIGKVLAKAADSSPVSIGRSLNTSALVNASAIGAALITAAGADVSSISEALAFGPARDAKALAALGQEISVEPWVPEKTPRVGPSKTGDGYWLAVASAQSIGSSLVDQVLGKYTDEASGGQLSVQDVAEKPEDVPVPEDGDEILSYVKLTGGTSDPDTFRASHVTLVIDKLWLIEGDIHPWSIQFNRYDEERAAWTPHLAKRSGENASEVYYTVAPSSFSLWSISGREGGIPPKRFVVESMYTDTAYEGEELTATARVTNLTDSPQNYNAVLWLNSETYMTRSVLIPGGLTKEIRFTLSLPADTYDLRLGRISRTVTIKQSKEVATAVVEVVPTVAAQPTIAKSATPTPKVVGATPTALPTSISAPSPVPTAIGPVTTTGGGLPIMFIIIGIVAVLALAGVALVIMKGRGGNRESE